MSNKYKNAKIYKITSNHSDLIYIGSTTQKRLSSRKTGHICQYKRWVNNNSHFTSSFELIKLGDIDICLIEEFPCDNKEQLHKRERFYIENTINCVNINKPISTNQEQWANYKIKNKEKIKQKQRDYYLDNKEKRFEYLKINKERDFETRKKYREDNKDKIKEEQHKYYLENKEKKKEYNKIYAKQYYQKKLDKLKKNEA